jgi:predicted TIM-barrel fold metal-dependent hydrolase
MSRPGTVSRRVVLASAAGLMAQTPSFRITDSHVHVWKRDPKYPWAPETRNPPEEDRSVEMLLDLMKSNGVARTVIIQVIHYRWDNSYVADVLKKYPKTFQGVARVNPEDPAAPDHLSRLVREQKFKGVRLSPNATAAGDWIRGPLMPPLWKRCDELKVPMTLLAPVSRMPDAARLIEKFPNLTVVIDHMADSPIDQLQELNKLLDLARYPKVFVKLSHAWSLSKQEFPWRDTWPQIQRLYDRFGPKRLMWGTDWPVSLRHATYEQALRLYRDEIGFFNKDDKTWILAKTAETVWFPG